ncbi:LOW QUALITY PROTEIN: carbonyl reductase [NADPH] 1-like [Branchiostoma floridae]|uniref:carbonyl reductase (NADPH) n=1 Tax=Branchiostoma floridae TaxID=7739 RepID=A0A9J7LTX3_BRAFL|nr:LOW QUALITY PROTEIN: carbonyl reductase [NADPH] 1-like [Branchiostoma floridae]
MSRVAVVTGSNKGIGFEIVRGLCKQLDGIVYLTARNEKLGQEAVQKLKSEGLNPSFHQLDITNEQSIQALKQHLQDKHGGLDVLVNNAGFAYDGAATAPFGTQAEDTVGVNFFGTLAVSKALLPIIRPHGRVVNVSSQSSQMSLKKCSAELQARFRDRSIQEEELVMTLNKFIEMAKAGKHEENGFADWAYGMSKIGVTVLTFIQAREMEKDSREDILVNCMCPGWCKSDTTGWERPPRSAAEGADTALFLALLPAPNTKDSQGLFFYDRKPMAF